MASDHKRVNRGEDYEVRYMSKTRGVSKKAVKKASKKEMNFRKGSQLKCLISSAKNA